MTGEADPNQTRRLSDRPPGSILDDGIDHDAYHQHLVHAEAKVDRLARRLAGVAAQTGATGPWLDAGAGPGVLLRRLKDHLPDETVAVAIDSDPLMVDLATRELAGRANVTIQQADIEQRLPFADDTFGAAMCANLLHHVADPDRAVSELARILRPGGLLLVVEVDSSQWRSRIFRAGYALLRRTPLDWPIAEALYRSLAVGRTGAGWAKLITSCGFRVRRAGVAPFNSILVATLADPEN